MNTYELAETYRQLSDAGHANWRVQVTTPTPQQLRIAISNKAGKEIIQIVRDPNTEKFRIYLRQGPIWQARGSATQRSDALGMALLALQLDQEQEQRLKATGAKR